MLNNVCNIDTICVYVIDLRKFSHFHIEKLLFLSIVGTSYTHDILVGLHVTTTFQLYQSVYMSADLRKFSHCQIVKLLFLSIVGTSDTNDTLVGLHDCKDNFPNIPKKTIRKSIMGGGGGNCRHPL